jgi:hypothetical protein
MIHDRNLTSECISTSQPFYQAFHQFCQTDKLLRGKIQLFKISSHDAGLIEMIVQPCHLEVFCKKFLRIAQWILLVGSDRFHSIQLNEINFKLEGLLSLQPGLCRLEGINDRRAQVEQINQNAQRYRALLGFATCKSTVMIISTTGIYKDIHLQQGIASQIPIEEMLNKSLDEVLPDLQTAFYVLQQIKEAYAAQEGRTIQYGLWDRTYSSQIVPIAGAQEVVLVCNRLS